MRECRHHVAGLRDRPGPDRKRFKGEPSVQYVPTSSSSTTQPWGVQASFLGGSPSYGFNDPSLGTQPLPGLYDLGYKRYQSPNPQFFPGSTIAGFTPQQMQAMTMQENRATAGSPLTRNSINTAGAYAGGDFSNPAIQGVLDANRRSIQPAVDTRFSQSGRTFSPAHAQALGRGITDANAPYLFGAQQNAMGMTPTLAGAEYADISALGSVGAQQQAMGQAGINEDIRRHDFGQNVDAVKLQQYRDLISGNAGSTTMSTGTQPVVGAAAANPYAMGLGGLLGAGSVAGDLGARPFAK